MEIKIIILKGEKYSCGLYKKIVEYFLYLSHSKYKSYKVKVFLQEVNAENVDFLCEGNLIYPTR